MIIIHPHFHPYLYGITVDPLVGHVSNCLSDPSMRWSHIGILGSREHGNRRVSNEGVFRNRRLQQICYKRQKTLSKKVDFCLLRFDTTFDFLRLFALSYNHDISIGTISREPTPTSSFTKFFYPYRYSQLLLEYTLNYSNKNNIILSKWYILKEKNSYDSCMHTLGSEYEQLFEIKLAN